MVSRFLVGYFATLVVRAIGRFVIDDLLLSGNKVAQRDFVVITVSRCRQ
jgi:hypothetical protein